MSEIEHHLQRMAATGSVGSIGEWNEFSNRVLALRAEKERLRTQHQRIVEAADKAKADTSGQGGAYGNGFRDGIEVCGDISRAALTEKPR